MKVNLEFDLEIEGERELYETYKNAEINAELLELIWTNVFRPFEKHGYDDIELQTLIDNNDCVADAIARLIERYRQVLKDARD